MKIMVVLGTRPEAIKLAPVIDVLKKHTTTVVVSSGQHREMLVQALSSFDIVPDIEADAMVPGQTLNELASRVLGRIDAIIAAEKPDWVLVQGDTTTAFVAGLAAFNRSVRIGHVEAGLRTGDLSSPFPEEANRKLLSCIATVHFAPTKTAKANLLAEGVKSSDILVTGNTVVDAIDLIKGKWRDVSPQGEWSPNELSRQILVTCHRRENFGEVMLGICGTLKRLCSRYQHYNWLFPVHLNPAVREPVMRELAGIGNLQLMEPVNYQRSLQLIGSSALVVSDSGGVQEEAPSFGVPVVVMRNHTERHEGVDAGFATLAGSSPEGIEVAVHDWLSNPSRLSSLKGRQSPYGDGQASMRILKRILSKSSDEFGG